MYEFTWTFSGKADSQIKQEMTFRCTVLDIWSFRGAACDTDYYQLFAEVNEMRNAEVYYAYILLQVAGLLELLAEYQHVS